MIIHEYLHCNLFHVFLSKTPWNQNKCHRSKFKCYTKLLYTTFHLRKITGKEQRDVSVPELTRELATGMKKF